MENKSSKIEKFLKWWNAPITKKDRFTALFIGAFSGFWLGGLGRIMLGVLPVSISDVGLWALGGIIVFSLLGLVFQKVITCICYPFSNLMLATNKMLVRHALPR
jgi:hypothetical protein